MHHWRAQVTLSRDGRVLTQEREPARVQRHAACADARAFAQQFEADGVELRHPREHVWIGDAAGVHVEISVERLKKRKQRVAA